MFEDLLVLREILQRELETINAYERMLSRVEDPNLRRIIEHVTDEEREHVSEMYELIMERDPRLSARSEVARSQLASMMHKDAATVSLTGDAAAKANGSPGAPLSTSVSQSDGGWSVGSLKARSL